MKRSFSANLFWLAVCAAVICAGCRPSQSAPVAKASPAKPAEQAADTPPPVKGPDAGPVFSLSEPDQPGTAKAAVAPAAALAPDTILVKVNDKVVTQADLDKETKSVEKMMAQRGLSAQQFASMAAALKPQMIDGLVTKILIEGECAAKKIVVSDEDIKKEIDTIKAMIPKDTSLEEVLRKQEITQSMLTEQIKDQLMVEKLLDITIPDAEIKQFYDDNKARLFETVRARHILIKLDPSDDEAKKKAKKEKADKLREQVAKGADFAKLAAENSDCPSKEFGGELKPPFRRGQMVKPFEEVAFRQKPNEISEVVTTDFGYHIIQTLEVQVQPFDEVKPRIAGMLKGKAIQKKADALIKQLKEKAKIEYLHGTTPPPPPEAMMFGGDEGPMSVPPEPAKAAAPEAKADGKADVKPEAAPKAKPEAAAKPEAKPAAKPDEKAGAKPEKTADEPK